MAVDLHANFTAAWQTYGWLPELFGLDMAKVMWGRGEGGKEGEAWLGGEVGRRGRRHDQGGARGGGGEKGGEAWPKWSAGGKGGEGEKGGEAWPR